MKCMDDELIQKFIDGETDPQETNLIKKHLAECTQCVRKVEEQRAFAETIKREINNMGKQTVDIPEFVAPTVRKFRLKKKMWAYLSAASAACAVLVVVFFINKQNMEAQPNATVQLIYGFNGDFDSNKTVSQQEMTFIMIDANGKIVEYN